jgi:long-chain acyl-CoA synthetase
MTMKSLADWIFHTDEGMDKKILSTLVADYSLNEIKIETERYIAMLREFGNIERKKVGLIVPSVLSFTALTLAINQLQGIVIPISPQFRKDDLSSILETLDPHLVFTVREHNGYALGIMVNDWADSSGKSTLIFETDDFLHWSRKEVQGFERDFDQLPIAIMGCSSGSTGVPKGIMITSDYFIFNHASYSLFLDWKEDDSVFSMIPTAGNFGVSLLMSGLYRRSLMVFPETFDFPAMVKRMKEKKCNKLIGTPSLFKALYMFSRGMDPSIMQQLDICGLAGEKIEEQFLANFPDMNTKFRSLYGLSELAGLMYTDDIRHGFNWKVIPSVAYKVGSDGEIAFNVNSGFLGYYNHLDLTAEVFRDGWFYTGDLVQAGDGDTLQIVGRKKDLIKKGGQQVVPGEVEGALMKHHQVKQAVVVGIPHPVFGEQIVAFIVADGHLEEQDIYSFTHNKIASYKVPDIVIFIDKIPVAQGKADKISLRKEAIEQYKGGAK